MIRGQTTGARQAARMGLALFVLLTLSQRVMAQVSIAVDVTVTAPDADSAQIQISLTNLPRGINALTMFMGREFAFTRTVDPAVWWIEATNERGLELNIAKNAVNLWRIETGGARSIDITYVIGLTQREHPDVIANRDEYEWPYVAADHGMLYTAAMLMLPRELDLDLNQLAVRIHPPAGWETIAPWPRDEDGTFRPPNLNAYLNDYIAIGAWQQTVATIGDFTATIAVAPGQERIVRSAIRPIRRIVEYELGLFEWDEPGQFLFCFGAPASKGAAGSPKANSMTLMVAPDEDPERAVETISHLIAHEFFHLWATAHIERMPDELRFFNEGFTEYYAWLVSARLGLITWDRFAEAIGDAILRCERLGSMPMSIAQAGGQVFFHDQKATQLVYQGGLLLAALLDARIRLDRPGATLDDFMQSLINDDQWRAAAHDGTRPSPSLNPDFRDAVAAFVDDNAWMEAYLSEISTIWSLNPYRAFASLGIDIEQRESAQMIEFGAMLEGRVIGMINPGLGADQLELQVGDELLECNGREIETTADFAEAWRGNEDGGIALRYRRGDDVYTVRAQLPRATEVIVPSEPWRD